MNTEHATPELFAALSAAQGEIENANKNAKNPHFKSSYADLAEILNTTRPVFAKHGLSLSQFPGFDGSLASVTTLVGHSGGGYISGVAACVPAKSDAQGIGSATTYLRRYGAAAAAGIAQEDDDGNAAAHDAKPAPVTTINASPTPGAWDGIGSDDRAMIENIAFDVGEYMEEQDDAGAYASLEAKALSREHKIALWTLLDSKTRAALKKAASAAKEAV